MLAPPTEAATRVGAPATATRPEPQRLAETVQGRVAVVTGGATGLGRSTALEFAQRGVAVAINYVDLPDRSEEHTSELQSQSNLVCRLLLEKKNSVQLNSLQNTWPYGYSMPIAVRYTQDAFSRSDWLWPVDAKVSRLKLPVIWLLVSMWLNTLTKSQIWTLLFFF